MSGQLLTSIEFLVLGPKPPRLIKCSFQIACPVCGETRSLDIPVGQEVDNGRFVIYEFREIGKICHTAQSCGSCGTDFRITPNTVQEIRKRALEHFAEKES